MAQQTPFYDLHVKSSAVMGERHGWMLPEHFGDLQAEINACENSIAVFDISHFSRIRFSGDQATEFMEGLIEIPLPGHQGLVKYHDLNATVQHQDKGLLLIAESLDHFSFLQQLENSAQLRNVKITDETFSTAMIALKGPKALALLKEKLPIEIDHIAPGDVVSANMFFMRFVIALGSNENITIILPAKVAPMAWEMLEKYGQDYDATLAGFETWEQTNSAC
jgi:aminomethyltransferase